MDFKHLINNVKFINTPWMKNVKCIEKKFKFHFDSICK